MYVYNNRIIRVWRQPRARCSCHGHASRTKWDDAERLVLELPSIKQLPACISYKPEGDSERMQELFGRVTLAIGSGIALLFFCSCASVQWIRPTDHDHGRWHRLRRLYRALCRLLRSVDYRHFIGPVVYRSHARIFSASILLIRTTHHLHKR